MQKNKAPGRQWSLLYYHLVLVSCLAFLSSCTFSTANNSTDATQPQAKILSSVTKSADPIHDKAQAILAKMSLDNKIAQMILVMYNGNDYASTGLQQMVAQQHVGGVLYQELNHNFDPPVDTAAAVNEFSMQITSEGPTAPLIAIDEEGGDVDKVSQFFPASPSAESLALSGDPNQAYNQAKRDASELRQLGINTDLAPVVDVGPDTNILKSRMYSADQQTVAIYAGSFVKGLQDKGIVGTLKHFPGLGSTDQDPHATLPVISKSLTELQSSDFVPYKQIIQQDNPAMIMTTDVLTQALDPNNPADISPKVVEYLRQTLHFNGVIVTDALNMGGLYPGGDASFGPSGEPTDEQLTQVCVQAIEAGNDLIEGPSNSAEISNIVTGVKSAIQQGKLSQSQIDQSAMRILMMKIKYGIIK
jgi:Beta-glucosidase-related glycosidases